MLIVIGLSSGYIIYKKSELKTQKALIDKGIHNKIEPIPEKTPDKAPIIVLPVDDSKQDKKDNTADKINNEKKDDHKDISKPVNKPIKKGDKVAYLTFDDGPSVGITPQILDILKKNNIKATFFVIGKNIAPNKDIFLREKSEGHAIGNHTFDHNVDFIYKAPKNLVDEFKQGESTIKEFYPGYKAKIVRFPGGSKNRPKEYREAVRAAGYKYFDWNCLTKDAEGANVPVDQLDRNIKQNFTHQKDLIVLMHDSDGKDTTVEYLPQLIKFLEDDGYIFKTLN
ncbi:polysaccharide deacetylase [Clostridiales bacterium oral taxon 876 str. F0540]|nr:polysaccharide deacetylase [Clostridiales bacterium oral taxon 876 str. F0540]